MLNIIAFAVAACHFIALLSYPLTVTRIIKRLCMNAALIFWHCLLS